MEQDIIEQKAQKTTTELQKIYNLPAMSTVMMEVSSLLDSPKTTTTDLSNMIGKDQGLSTKVLTIANSPLYGLPRKVSTIDFAIMIIGFHDVKNIVIALSMIEAFKHKDDEFMSQKEFWLHSLITGNLAKRVSDDLGFKIGAESFISGLLHDLGIAIIHKYFPANYKEIVLNVQNNGIHFKDAQIESMGMTHQQIGFVLAENWNLPLTLCDTIRTHHKPSHSKENETIVSSVHLADYMTQAFKSGDFYWDEGIKLDESVLQALNFQNMEDIEKFIEGYKDLISQEVNSLRM